MKGEKKAGKYFVWPRLNDDKQISAQNKSQKHMGCLLCCGILIGYLQCECKVTTMSFLKDMKKLCLPILRKAA